MRRSCPGTALIPLVAETEKTPAVRVTTGTPTNGAAESTFSICPAPKNAASAIVAYSSAVSAALAAPARTRYSSEQPSLPQISDITATVPIKATGVCQLITPRNSRYSPPILYCIFCAIA